ncbi:rhomboid family intramembrane serine protease [Candidatus Woesebacteria bacterium]|nr:rhomboid family intramembrane serine protease [Candidatus Woesebacteria bacterium]
MIETKPICPDCGQALASRLVKNLAIEACSKCGGILLDPHEVTAYVNAAIPKSQVPIPPINLNHKVIKTFLHTTNAVCPRDATKFEIINYSYDSNILLERCPQCEVVWVRQHQIMPLAQYMKGNPLLKELGKAFVEDYKENHSSDQIIRGPYWVHLTTMPMPVNDEADNLETPYVVIAIVVLNCLVFICQILLGSNVPMNLFAFKMGSVFTEWSFFTLFTHQFMHANVLHLLSNLWILWIFGDNVETRLGHIKFLLFYLLSGAVAALGFSLFLPQTQASMVGASGAIAATLGAYLKLYPKQKVTVLFWNSLYKWTVWKYLIFWIGIQLASWILEIASQEGTHIAYGAHVIGFVFGLSVVYLLSKLRGGLIHQEDVSVK